MLIINQRCAAGREDLTYQNLLCCCCFVVSSRWLSTSPLVSFLRRSGQEMLNLDSPKLFNMEMGRQTWEYRCSGVLLYNKGVCIKTSIHLGCQKWCLLLVRLSQPGQAACASRSSQDLVVICLAAGFAMRWLLLGSLIYSGLRGMDEEA